MAPPLGTATSKLTRVAVAIAAACALLSAPAAATTPPTSGGGAITGPAGPPTPSHVPAPPSKRDRGKWLKRITITEYWPAPEWWFVGKLVSAPGLPGKHPIDWLYSAQGLSMEGDGIGNDGRIYRIDALGDGGWVTADGKPTDATQGWNGGAPYWRAGGYWKTRSGAVTFPLRDGGWAAGVGRKYVPLPNVSFAVGQPLPLRFLQSVAVDPSVIPLGSRVYIPAYRHDGHGGWFLAQDTGGAIRGHHVDIYRRPPASASEPGQYLTDERIYVIKPAAHH